MIVLSIQPNLEPPEDRPLGMCGELLPTADRTSSQAKVGLNEKERELSNRCSRLPGHGAVCLSGRLESCSCF